MTTDFTKKVTKALLEIAKDCKSVVNTSKEENIWLGIPKGKQKKATYFIPDVLYVTKRGVIIFQICDAQSKSQKQIAGDYLTALLSQEVKKIYFISPENKAEEIKNSLFVYNSILKHKFKLKDYQLINFRVIGIADREYKLIKSQLIEFIEKEKLGYSKK